MKRISKITIFILTFVLLLTLIPSTVLAESYTHWYTKTDKRSVSMHNVFEVKAEIDGYALNADYTLDGLNDIYVYTDLLYVLCGDLSKILVFDNQYKVKKEIAVKSPDGTLIDFTGARGIFVDNSNILIADTEHARILVCDTEGILEQEIGLPESTIIPDTYIYKPTKVLKDQRGYLYIISEGSYYGALLFDSQYNFLSFYGANESKPNISDILQNLWNRFFATNEQLSKQMKTLPYQFTNFCMGSDGFMYTVTGATELYATSTGQIIKLSPGGSNVLFSYDTLGEAEKATSFNFGETSYLQVANINQMQSFSDIYVDNNKFIYTIDKTYGIVYVYDSNCNLIIAFGGGFGAGKREDTFYLPVAITKFGDDLVIADANKKSLVIFEITEFGDKLFKAQKLKIDGNYEQSRKLWEEVLSKEQNCQMAYIGLAATCLENGDYELGLEYARQGQSYDLYNQIYEQISKNFLRENMIWLLLGSIVFIIAIVIIIKIIMKHLKIKLFSYETKEKLRLPFEIILHPVNSFIDLKYKKKGSVFIGVSIAILYYITDIISVTSGGFLFTKFDTFTFNSLFSLARTAGLIILWAIVNWAVCSLLEGKGTLKEVFCVTTYSILPLIFYNIIFLILSNILPLSTAVFLNGINVVAILFTAFLLIIGMINIHEYSFKKFIITSLITLVGMILVVFIGFVMAILLQQFFNFFVSIYTELIYR